jgi:hypothetical protein
MLYSPNFLVPGISNDDRLYDTQRAPQISESALTRAGFNVFIYFSGGLLCIKKIIRSKKGFTMEIAIQCAWCRKHMGEKESKGSIRLENTAPIISHSICPTCYAIVSDDTKKELAGLDEKALKLDQLKSQLSANLSRESSNGKRRSP